MKLIELIIVFASLLTPQFLLASKIDGDEFAKSSGGIAVAGVLLTAYKVWSAKSEDTDGSA